LNFGSEYWQFAAIDVHSIPFWLSDDADWQKKLCCIEKIVMCIEISSEMSDRKVFSDKLVIHLES
jgi:hypothetical protein